jgi:hypothetical protein
MRNHPKLDEDAASKRQSGAITGSRFQKDPTKSLKPSHETPSKFSTRPAELLGGNRVALLNCLGSTDPPFRVNMVQLSSNRKRRKRSYTLLDVQDDLFEERLAVKYKVEPRKE